jgi:hypothetical protein
MLGLVLGLLRTRAARPLLWWVLGLLAYVIVPIPREWVLLLVVGLGTALSVTVARLREAGRGARQHVTRGWTIAERLTDAVADRIRGTQPHLGHEQYGATGHTPNVTYDPGALLTAVVAVLAAEGLDIHASPALPACAQLLTWQGIDIQAGAPAEAALTLATALRPGPQRRRRVMPAGLLAAVIRAVLTADGVLPAQITTDDADALITATALILHALHIAPDDTAGGLDAWPLIAELVSVVPLPPPYDPPAAPYGYR